MVGSKSKRENGSMPKVRQVRWQGSRGLMRHWSYSSATQSPNPGKNKSRDQSWPEECPATPQMTSSVPQSEQSMGWSLGTKPQQVLKTDWTSLVRAPSVHRFHAQIQAVPLSLACSYLAEAAQFVFTSAQVCSLVSCFPEQGPGRTLWDPILGVLQSCSNAWDTGVGGTKEGAVSFTTNTCFKV